MTTLTTPGALYKLTNRDGGLSFNRVMFSKIERAWVFKPNHLFVKSHSVRVDDCVLFLGEFDHVTPYGKSRCVAFLHEDCLCGVTASAFWRCFVKVS